MQSFKRLWSYFLPYKFPIAVGLILGYVVIAVNLINPYITKMIFDRVFKGGEESLLVPLLFAMVIFTALKHGFQYLKAYLIETNTMEIVVNLRNDLMKKFLSLSYETFNNEKTGHILQIMNNDVEHAKNCLANTIPALIETIVTFIVACIILINLSPSLTFATLAVMPIVYFRGVLFSEKLHPVLSDIRTQISDTNTVVQENINGVRIVRAFANEEYEKQKLDKENKNFRRLNNKLILVIADNYWKMNIISQIPNILLLSYGAYLTIEGKISLGTFVAFSSYITYIMNPINLLPGYISAIQNSSLSTEKVFNFLDIEPRIKNIEDGGVEVSEFKDSVKLENVSVVSGGVKILSNIDLNIEKGKKIGILGATGSGKTTIVNLIGRYLDPTSGSITFDGIPLHKINLESLRKKLSYAMQDVFLFSDTVCSNIAFSDDSLSEEEIENFAEKACAKGFIERLTDGFNTIVGERGIGLSGGQKQRISVARALAKDSSIIIFDDTTSALDMETEQDLLLSLKNSIKGKTVVMIANRISSVLDSDEIIVLDHGEIIERGTHEELLALNGKYRETFDVQFRDYFAEKARLSQEMKGE